MPNFPFTQHPFWSNAERQRWLSHTYLHPSTLKAIPSDNSLLLIAPRKGGATTATMALEWRATTKKTIVRRTRSDLPIFYGIVNAIMEYVVAMIERSPTPWESFSERRFRSLRDLYVHYNGYDDPESFARWADIAPLPTKQFQQIAETMDPVKESILNNYGDVWNAIRGILLSISSPPLLIICDHASIDSAALTTFFTNCQQGWLDQAIDTIRIIITIEAQTFQRLNVPQRALDRFQKITLEWDVAEIEQIANRHLALAISNPPVPKVMLEYLFSQEDRSQILENAIALIGKIPPAGVSIAEAIYFANHGKITTPLSKEASEESRLELYRRYGKLYYDFKTERAWRGREQLPPFPDVPRRVFELLYRLRNNVIDPVSAEFHSLVGSSDNRYAVISRIRKIIEPIPSKPIYLINNRSEGYWLEHLRE